MLSEFDKIESSCNDDPSATYAENPGAASPETEVECQVLSELPRGRVSLFDKIDLMLEEIGKPVKVWGEIRDAVEAEREKAKKAKAKAMRNEAKKMAKSSDPIIRANAELVKTEAEKVEKAA